VRGHRDRGRDGSRETKRVERHNRLARILANAFDAAAGPDWNAGTGFDVRLQDVPLTNRRPDVVVYRADTIDVSSTRPEHVLLVAEIVSPGSETTDRIVKLDQYARGHCVLLARGADRDGHPGRIFLPARLCEQTGTGKARPGSFGRAGALEAALRGWLGLRPVS
jgi:Putative restriction endonuclease